MQLKRRYDLIPNLVETVKGYAAHERQTLEAVIQARNMAMSAQGPAQQAQAENMITGALKSLFALSEAYPDLKANQNFLNLQEELTGTEGRIAYARQFYNDTVQRYNTKIQTFPANVLAGQFRVPAREYFEVEDAEAGASSTPSGRFGQHRGCATPPDPIGSRPRSRRRHDQVANKRRSALLIAAFMVLVGPRRHAPDVRQRIGFVVVVSAW